jgi:hypothetical protein
VAIFEGKRVAGTLPDGADARYLLGIVKNIARVHEADAITSSLFDERLAARDRLFEPLRLRHAQIASAHCDISERLRALCDEAMRAQRTIERLFWIHAAAELLCRHDEPLERELFLSAARRIHATFRGPRHERAAAERRLARRLWPLRYR